MTPTRTPLAAAVTSAGAVPYRVPAVPDERSILREAASRIKRCVRTCLSPPADFPTGAAIPSKDVLFPLGGGAIRQHCDEPGPSSRIGVGKLEGWHDHLLPARRPRLRPGCVRGIRQAVAAQDGWVRRCRARTCHGCCVGRFLSDDGVRDFVRVAISPDRERGFTCEVLREKGQEPVVGVW